MSITVCQIMALRAARNIGIKVPKTTIDRAYDYVIRSAIENGRERGGFKYQEKEATRTSYSLTAAGVATLHNTGTYDHALISAGVDYLKREFFTAVRENSEATTSSGTATTTPPRCSSPRPTAGVDNWKDFYWPRITDVLLKIADRGRLVEEHGRPGRCLLDRRRLHHPADSVPVPPDLPAVRPERRACPRGARTACLGLGVERSGARPCRPRRGLRPRLRPAAGRACGSTRTALRRNGLFTSTGSRGAGTRIIQGSVDRHGAVRLGFHGFQHDHLPARGARAGGGSSSWRRSASPGWSSSPSASHSRPSSSTGLFRLPVAVRTILAVGSVLGLAAFAVRKLFKPLGERQTSDGLALMVERSDPSLQDRLISALQLKRDLDAGRAVESPELIRVTVDGAVAGRRVPQLRAHAVPPAGGARPRSSRRSSPSSRAPRGCSSPTSRRLWLNRLVLLERPARGRRRPTLEVIIVDLEKYTRHDGERTAPSSACPSGLRSRCR